jgi:hypothetical protein
MKLKTLIALAVAGAFAVPFAAQASASGDRIILADGPSGAGSTGTGMTGGTPSTRSSGEPKAATQKSDANRAASAPAFTTLDTNSDGQISQAEWDKHYRSGSAATGSSSAPMRSSGSATSGATSPAPSGPGTKSQAGPGSDTATSAGTSGKGKAQ